MYTVARFIDDSGTTEQLFFVGKKINEVVPQKFERLDRIGGRFSVSVCDSHQWEKHKESIEDFVRMFSEAISLAKSYGICIEFDVAIEPEDYGSLAYISLDVNQPLLQCLNSSNVALILSYYKAS